MPAPAPSNGAISVEPKHQPQYIQKSTNFNVKLALCCYIEGADLMHIFEFPPPLP